MASVDIMAPCGRRCLLPAADPQCHASCAWPSTHAGRCACDAHIVDAFAPLVRETSGGLRPRAPAATPSKFLVLVELVEASLLSPRVALSLWRAGVRSKTDIVASDTANLQTVTALETGDVQRLLAAVGTEAEPMELTRLRTDHPVVRHT